MAPPSVAMKGDRMDATPLQYYGLPAAVYHTDPRCPVGLQIPREWRLSGTAYRRLCNTCRARADARPPSGPHAAYLGEDQGS